ncbi:MAG: LacI family DNA-binding transcriptional regulator [Pseudomonadota bacterium]
MKDRQKSTIYDIARLAGTSASTVSYALNGRWQERRIKRDTVERIQKIARENGYQVNLQARGLRNASSGLAGMILPEHDTRFFSDLSQAFALEVRARGSCPAIVLSGRGREAQEQSVQTLLSYNVDTVVIAGATDPMPLSAICRSGGVPHVFVDHPCPDAPSVVTDNYQGALALTQQMLATLPPARPDDPGNHVFFLGGEATLPATERRIAAFRDATRAAGALHGSDQVIACGYSVARAETEIAELHARLGRMPAGLFVNSISCFEGVVKYLAAIPEGEMASTVLGCFDYDPFGALLRFPVTMVRQRADVMISEAFARLDEGFGAPSLSLISPELVSQPMSSTRTA